MAEVWLTVRTPNRRALTLMIDGLMIVGRDCDGLIVADQRVSRRHTSFEPAGDQIRVVDLESSNGTWVNGVRIAEGTLITPADQVIIGDTRVTMSVVSDSEPIAHATQIITATNEGPQTSIERVADSVDEQGVAAHVLGVENEAGTLTVVFSDIESSTELALAMGDTVWFDVLRQHHDLVQAHVGAHRGRIVKNQGDGYMLCFRSARQALLACIGMQHDLERHIAAGADHAVRVRMGAHTGEVVMQDDGDIFGKHVIVAARVGAVADGAQILVSSLVKQIAEPRGDIGFHSPIEAELKGLDGATTVYEVDWQGFTA